MNKSNLRREEFVWLTCSDLIAIHREGKSEEKPRGRNLPRCYGKNSPGRLASAKLLSFLTCPGMASLVLLGLPISIINQKNAPQVVLQATWWRNIVDGNSFFLEDSNLSHVVYVWIRTCMRASVCRIQMRALGYLLYEIVSHLNQCWE